MSQRRIRFNVSIRPTIIEVDAKRLHEAVADGFIRPAQEAWNAMMASLALDAADIMRVELPRGKRSRGIPLRATVKVDPLPDGYWIRPTKMVDGIPLGLIIEGGTVGGTVIVPVKGEYLRFERGGRMIYTKRVFRGLTKPNRYSERTLTKLGRIANIEARFWHFYRQDPRVQAWASGGMSAFAEKHGKDYVFEI